MKHSCVVLCSSVFNCFCLTYSIIKQQFFTCLCLCVCFVCVSFNQEIYKSLESTTLITLNFFISSVIYTKYYFGRSKILFKHCSALSD